MIYLGIDPGKGGGLASVDEDGTALRVDQMPITLQDLWLVILAHKGGSPFTAPDMLPAVKRVANPVKCVMEWVSSSPQMGVVSAHTFGRGFGNLEAFLVAADIPYDLTVPRKWQDVMQCRTGGDKNISKARAQQLFPALKVTHAIADALLIAEYCRRKERGSPTV